MNFELARLIEEKKRLETLFDYQARCLRYEYFLPSDREKMLADRGVTIPCKTPVDYGTCGLCYGGSGTSHYFPVQEGFNPFPLLHPENMIIKVPSVLTLQQFLEIEGEQYEAT